MSDRVRSKEEMTRISKLYLYVSKEAWENKKTFFTNLNLAKGHSIEVTYHSYGWRVYLSIYKTSS